VERLSGWLFRSCCGKQGSSRSATWVYKRTNVGVLQARVAAAVSARTSSDCLIPMRQSPVRRRQVEGVFFLANASSMATRLKLLSIVILSPPALACGRQGRQAERRICFFPSRFTLSFHAQSVIPSGVCGARDPLPSPRGAGGASQVSPARKDWDRCASLPERQRRDTFFSSRITSSRFATGTLILGVRQPCCRFSVQSISTIASWPSPCHPELACGRQGRQAERGISLRPHTFFRLVFGRFCL
jgi:hypothetical protein